MKWEEILKSKRTKGDFVNGHNVRFTLKHPDFPYPGVNKNIYVKLDSALNLSQKIDLKRIPNFLLDNQPSNWLSAEQLNNIAKEQNLKSSVKPLKMVLQFDNDRGEYYWMVINTLYEEKCYSDCEILHIDPIGGMVKEHTEERLTIMHCY